MPQIDDRIFNLLRKDIMTVKDLAEKVGTTQKDVKRILMALKGQGILLKNHGEGKWSIPKEPLNDRGIRLPYTSRPDNTFVFGFTGDSHLCSKYERLDVLNDLYDRFELRGVDCVFHTGNWVDGECRLNRYDLHTHGLDDQLDYLIENYPRKPFVTNAVTGDDHEGWWAKDMGIDVGQHLYNKMLRAGRADWRNIGYMEGYVDLVNYNSKVENSLLVMHPGGGTGYAISYRPQKIVEGMTGGEKPGVLLLGHYHKLSYNVIRNVHTIQTGCCEDQTIFMRKKGLEAHVGGGICSLTQDPKTGFIIGCQVEFFTNYGPKTTKNGRWGYAGKVTK